MPLMSLLGCPCLNCEKINMCFKGGHHDPATCLDLTNWIEDNVEVNGFPCPVCSKVLPTERSMKIHVSKTRAQRYFLLRR